MTTVYVIRDAADALLYVGCTSNLPRRLAAHRRGRHWWPEVKRIELAWFADAEEAFSEELTRIGRLRPLHNVNGNPRYPCAEEPDCPPTARNRKAESLWRLRRASEYAYLFERADVERFAAEVAA